MMEAVQLSKNTLRKEIKQRLTGLSSEYKKKQSEIVLKKLLSLPIFKESRRISVYLNTKDEVSTEPILQTIFETNRKCFIPRYDDHQMEMVKLHSMKDFESLPVTKWNIKQPSLTDRRENALETGGLDIIIVPGVAFTVNGARMGHGKGYYDTFLAKCIDVQDYPPKTIALSFKEQIVDNVPCHENDIKLDIVLHPDYDIDHV